MRPFMVYNQMNNLGINHIIEEYIFFVTPMMVEMIQYTIKSTWDWDLCNGFYFDQ